MNGKSINKLLYFLILALLIGSCSLKQSNAPREVGAQQVLFDSLEKRCYGLVSRLQVDSLRTEAEQFMALAPAQSEIYFRARQFYINSWFNARDYEQVLTMLDETATMPGFAEQPGTVANYMYTRARCYQLQQRYDEAIATAEQLIRVQPSDSTSTEVIRKLAVNTLQNVMNMFYLSDQTKKGLEWFRNLRAHPPTLLAKCCQREMMLFHAYLACMDCDYAQSEVLMDSALAIPFYRLSGEDLYRDYLYATGLYIILPHREKDLQPLLRKVIQLGREVGHEGCVAWAKSKLGFYYQRKQLFAEAIDLQFEGLGAAVMRRDSVACTSIYGDLAELYNQIGLYPQARYYLGKSAQWAPSYDSTINKALYYMTLSGVNGGMQGTHLDLDALAKADSCFAICNNPAPGVLCVVGLAEGFISQYPDSLHRALSLLDHLPQRYQVSLPLGRIEVARALAFVKLGQEVEARKILLKIDKYEGDIYNHYLDTLIRHFSERKDAVMVSHLCQVREPLLGPYINVRNRNATIAADIKYKTREKDLQLHQQEAKLEMHLLQRRYYASIIGGMILLLMGGVWYYWHRLRLHRLSALLAEQERLTAEQALQITLKEREMIEERLQARESELKQAMISLQEANERTVSIEQDLAQLVTTPETTLQLTQMTSKLLSTGEESRFRRIFAERHPYFLIALRSQVVGVTAGEELLCMLIVLGQTADEVANTLCISRDSVNKSRYRLRKKIAIKREDSLEEFLNQIFTTSSTAQ